MSGRWNSLPQTPHRVGPGGARQGFFVNQLSVQQRELVSSLAMQLGAIRGIRAVVLGGSHARGRALPSSDIDLGILYAESAPFSVASLRDLAEKINDRSGPVVTGFYEWGPWVNGGAWLAIGGQRIDFIYRSIERLERVIDDAEAGRYEVGYAQQPPFGFFSGTYLGEITTCIALHDPEKLVSVLKARLANYPDTLRCTLVQDYLWAAEFGLAGFARKFAYRADAYGTASCLTRAVNQLVLVLFALNRKYLVNDKTAVAEIAEFEHAPCDFQGRAQKTFAHLDTSAVELIEAVECVSQLVQETIDLAEGLYRPRYALGD